MDINRLIHYDREPKRPTEAQRSSLKYGIERALYRELTESEPSAAFLEALDKGNYFVFLDDTNKLATLTQRRNNKHYASNNSN